MGQFSWLDCKTQEQVIDGKRRDVFVLIPKEFGGGHITEHCYDGYGHFGGKDIYDLAADWNREFISKHPCHMLKHHGAVRERSWYKAFSDLSASREDVVKTVADGFGCPEWRTIGIELACYDEDNASLKYPIKITHDPDAVYEESAPSLSDPNQGWEAEDDDDDDGCGW